MLAYPCSLPLSAHTLAWLAEQVRAHRVAIGSRWRRLDPGRQALLVLAHLRCGDTYARLAGGFGIGIATVSRYVHEVIELLAGAAPSLERVVAAAARLLYVILDGTVIPMDRVAADRPYFSGKHHRHGLNVQILAGSRGQLLWASPALPGAIHDLAAARHHHIPATLAKHSVACYADAAYQAAGPHIAVPFRRRPKRLSVNQRLVNRNQAAYDQQLTRSVHRRSPRHHRVPAARRRGVSRPGHPAPVVRSGRPGGKRRPAGWKAKHRQCEHHASNWPWANCDRGAPSRSTRVPMDKDPDHLDRDRWCRRHRCACSSDLAVVVLGGCGR